MDGLPLHRSLLDVEGPVDLAVIAVPAAAVLETARDCARKGVRSLVVISAGFAEAGPRAPRASASCSPSAAQRECALSDPTASGSSTPRPMSG